MTTGDAKPKQAAELIAEGTTSRGQRG